MANTMIISASDKMVFCTWLLSGVSEIWIYDKNCVIM